MRRSNLWLLSFLLAGCLLLLGSGFSLPDVARALPLAVLTLLGVCILLALARESRAGKPASPGGDSPSRRNLLGTAGLTFVYLAAIPLVGYLLATALFLLLLMTWLRVRSPAGIAASIGLSLSFIWFIFFRWLQVLPPKSLIGF